MIPIESKRHTMWCPPSPAGWIFRSYQYLGRRRGPIQFWFNMLILCLLTATPGCLSRRMTFVSNPPGAMVLLEGKEIGYSPASTDFTYYGTRQVTMIKDGYETRTDYVTVAAPWYQWPVLEFFFDNFTPHRITDRRVYSYDLQPKQLVPEEELKSRAQQLRNESQIGQ